MPDFALFEDSGHFELQPFTFTRPSYLLRSGILTFKEKWEQAMGIQLYNRPHESLRNIFEKLSPLEDVIWINGRFGPDPFLLTFLNELAPNSYLKNEEGEILLFRSSKRKFFPRSSIVSEEELQALGYRTEQAAHRPLGIRSLSCIFRFNREFIQRDFELMTKTVPRQKLNDPYTRVYGKDNLFVAEGASIKAAIINAEDGPVYIGRGANIQEGSIIVNSHAIGDHATVSAGAKLRGDSSLGPWTKVGGELGNSVIMGYSNKGHDGYMGNSVLGYWCNLGADSNTSNLKNNYSNIKSWHYPSMKFRDTGLQFQGLMMGDHSKCGINTMFNTGTVVGVSANIFGGDFPPKFIPSFAWGGSEGFETYQLEKAMETARRVMQRRKVELSWQEERLLAYIFEQSSIFRNWEANS